MLRPLAVAVLVAALAALVVAFGSVAGAQAAASVQSGGVAKLRDAAGLHVVSVTRLDERLLEFTVTTSALTGPTGVRVLLPEGYDPARSKRYPVLYLLHGAGGSQIDWTVSGDAAAITEPYPVITVMPSGGRGGWYGNWLNFGKGGPPEWETYHIDQLLPFIDANFRTIPRRGARAIAGLSMGGFGAVSYAARHPDRFIATASFSGALDASHPAGQVVVDIPAGLDGGKPGQANGFFKDDPLPWLARDPLTLSPNLRGLRVATYVNEGNLSGDFGNLIEAWAHQTFVTFNANLTRLRIPHTAVDNGPGSHVWQFWRQDLRAELPSIMARFADPPKRPTTFAFTAAERRYTIYGWRISLTRPGLEFSNLKVGRRGFSLTGSGDARVTSSRRYRSGRVYRVLIDPAKGPTVVRRLRADDLGRLRIRMPLGPHTPGTVTGKFTTRVTIIGHRARGRAAALATALGSRHERGR